jgi:ubiquitin-like modifier-activating enzyme ATG7
MRGFLHNFQNLVVKGRSYDCCSACSPTILEAYESGGWEFVKRALCERGYVDEVSGLAEVHRRAEEADKAGWSESDEDDGAL